MKASDVADTAVLALVARPSASPLGWTIWDIQSRFPAYPERVVTAKLRALRRRHLIHGCLCGCRGDITISEMGRVWLLDHP